MLSRFRKKTYNNSIKPVILLVLDGWGIAPPSKGNAITSAKTPNMDNYVSTYPHGELIASGESVGLPANEVGNSEVGHLTIGAGRVVYQSLVKISNAISEGDFYENEAFAGAISHIRKHNSKLHIMGLVSTGSVHSSLEHFDALLELCRRTGLRNVNMHLFTDGRDAPPKEGLKIIANIESKIDTLGVGSIASVSGRYYAMDRDARWARTKKVYDAMVLGAGLKTVKATEAVKTAYERGETDEFIQPTLVGGDQLTSKKIEDNDAVIFFNFRVDRPRQLVMSFVVNNFENLKSVDLGYGPDQGTREGLVISGPTFERKKWPKNLFFVTMTEYQKNLPVSAVAFPPEDVSQPLSQVLSGNNLAQLHLTESEKERMVTFYFDGLKESNFEGEDFLIVPSQKVETYDKRPKMSVFNIVKELEKSIRKDKYHFFILNFANPDMVSHSGNLDATIKAIEDTDKAIGEVVKIALATDGKVIITADHGNAEELLTFPSGTFYFTTSKGEINTDHSNNPVPLLLISNQLQGKATKLPNGSLSDVAPTILNLMRLKIPQVMTGKNLLISI